jgi:hypothetical protein
MDRLLNLAGRRSRRERQQLLRAVADMFFATPQRSSVETGLFDDILSLVLKDVEPMARRELADRLAALEMPPRRTLLKLAGDEIAVAEPVLRHSAALDDDDLEPIAQRGSEPHLLAIAGRRSLSERLTDVLIAHRHDSVARVLAGNEGACMSAHGFAVLAEHAAANDNVLDLLIMRRDLPDKIATELLPGLAASMRARVEKLDIQIPDDIADGLVDEARTMLAERLRASSVSARPLKVLVGLIEAGDLRLGDAIIELADADHLVDIAALLSRRLRLRSDLVVINLFAVDVRPAMLFCRAAGLDSDAFSAILRLRNRRRREYARAGATLKDYLSLPHDLAASVIASVRSGEAG